MTPKQAKKLKSMHFSDMLRAELQGSSASKMRDLLSIILEKALIDKDVATCWKIVERLEGTASQYVTIAGDADKPLEVLFATSEDLLKKLRGNNQVEAVLNKITE